MTCARLLRPTFVALFAAALLRAQDTRPAADPATALADADARFEAAAAAESDGRPGLFVRSLYAEAADAYRNAAEAASADRGLRARALVGLGWAKGRGGDAEEGLKAFHAAALADPSTDDALFAGARLLLELGRAKECVARLAEVVSDPDAPSRGAAVELTIEALLDAGDRDAVRTLFADGVADLAFEWQAAAWRAVVVRLRPVPGDRFVAELVDAALKRDPADAAALFWKADAALARGANVDALRLFRNFRELRPLDFAAHLWTAVAEVRAGLLDAAKTSLAAAVEREPSADAAADAFRELAGGFFGAKRYEDAVAAQREAAARSGSHEDALNLGALLSDAGRTDEAAAAYEALLKVEGVRGPFRAKVWNYLGLLHRGRSDYDDAERCFREAVAAWDDERDARENLGILLLGNGEVEEGKRLLQWCVARETNRSRARFHLFLLEHPERPRPRDR